jgi:hypothetical protein
MSQSYNRSVTIAEGVIKSMASFKGKEEMKNIFS